MLYLYKSPCPLPRFPCRRLHHQITQLRRCPCCWHQSREFQHRQITIKNIFAVDASCSVQSAIGFCSAAPLPPAATPSARVPPSPVALSCVGPELSRIAPASLSLPHRFHLPATVAVNDLCHVCRIAPRPRRTQTLSRLSPRRFQKPIPAAIGTDLPVPRFQVATITVAPIPHRAAALIQRRRRRSPSLAATDLSSSPLSVPDKREERNCSKKKS
ncbi:hypothetical protein M0R45_000486 [Rubus argutus]|uniref:Uncharacterized protein n=1 Tax=Rubus argutus TaxID=59490 RepID=A0AAW1VPC7_RUBAR